MFPVLETERLYLQEIHAEDQAFVFEGLSHPRVIPFYGVKYDSYEATKAQMEWYQSLYTQGTGLPWKMVLKDSFIPCGVMAVYAYKPEHKKAEIGFWLLPSYWNKGLASEAIAAAAQYWLKEKKLHRLEAFVEEGNTASSRLLEKAGFTFEGKMKDCEIKEGRFISLLIYAKFSD